MVGAWEGDVASLEGPRSLTVEELPEAVALSTEVFDPGGTSMGFQFPLLSRRTMSGSCGCFLRVEGSFRSWDASTRQSW